MSAASGAPRWRPEVVWFADAMEQELRANDHKRHWLNLGMQTLSMRLTQEREELRDAVADGSAAETLKEAADVANFAMMIADKMRRSVPSYGERQGGNDVSAPSVDHTKGGGAWLSSELRGSLW
jgi:NTP pyrophosphatase (non-canonical NTP hydrolase)